MVTGFGLRLLREIEDRKNRSRSNDPVEKRMRNSSNNS